jgi:hypothetical protein
MTAIHHTTTRISELFRHFGTVTDISALTRCERDSVLYGPIVSAEHLQVIRLMIECRTTTGTTDGSINFARDGKKILAFCRAYADMFTAEWQKSIDAGNAAVRWEMVKIILRWIVEVGAQQAKQKCIDFHNKEITLEEWREYCGNKLDFIFYTDMEESEKTEIVAAYRDARDNFDEHLTRLWSELFAEKGVKGSVEWMRGFWTPVDEATKDRVNAAFLAAKSELNKN